MYFLLIQAQILFLELYGVLNCLLLRVSPLYRVQSNRFFVAGLTVCFYDDSSEHAGKNTDSA
jgi:hypothetical protein